MAAKACEHYAAEGNPSSVPGCERGFHQACLRDCRGICSALCADLADDPEAMQWMSGNHKPLVRF
ncbi:MAG: hypothetical protein LBH81_03260 [Rickettsiales bacterium]|nr:hypothetical protein [Rickettsiales bacterium]